MSRIGLHTAASFGFPAPASAEALQLAFEPTSCSIGVRSKFQHRYKSLRTIVASTQASPLYALLWRVSSVWVVPNGGHPDTALVDIDLVQGKTEELETSLAETFELRSAPLVSLLLSDVAKIDPASYDIDKLLNQLLGNTIKQAPIVVKVIAEELQATQKQIPSNKPHPSESSLRSFRTQTTLTSRRGLEDLALDNLPSLTAGIEDYDYILLAHKVRENPDFPIAPIWHVEYDSQRSWLDTALQLREEGNGDFFAHEVLLKKVLQELNGSGVFPHPGKLRSLRASAMAEAKKMMKAESEIAMAGEGMRLLRCKIEHLIPQVATTENQHKALRLIKLETLDAAKVMELSDVAIVKLLTAQTQLIMDDEDWTADLEKDCICDVVSEYSDDVDEHYWKDESVLDVICNKRRRDIIMDWILSAEASNIIHFELYIDDRNYCGPLEPDDETEETIMEEIKLKIQEEGVYGYPKIIFNRDADNNIVLPLDDGYLLERSEGFYTNLSGLTDTSSLHSASSMGDDQDQSNLEDSASSRNGSGSSKGTKGTSVGEEPAMKSNHNQHSAGQHPNSGHDYLGISRKDSSNNTASKGALISDHITAHSSLPGTRDTAIEYHDKRAAMAYGEGLNARRLNTLHMAWDIPHHAHGPQMPGMRPQHYGCLQKYTRPSPDWDAPNAPKPRFAQRVETSGLLDRFNKELEMKWEYVCGRLPEEVLDLNEFFAPRRPPHEDTMAAIYGSPPQYKASPVQRLPPSSPERFAYEAGIMNDDGELCINGQVIHTIPDSELEAEYDVFHGGNVPVSGYV